MHDIFAQQSDHPLFRYLEPKQREKVEQQGKLLTIAAGGYLIRKDQVDSTLFEVEKGRLEVVAHDESGKEKVVATIGPGDVLGEISFIDDSPRTVSVRATSEAQVRSWERKSLLEFLDDDYETLAKFSIALNELIVERLRSEKARAGLYRS